MVLDGCGLSVYPLLVLVGLNFLSVLAFVDQSYRQFEWIREGHGQVIALLVFFIFGFYGGSVGGISLLLLSSALCLCAYSRFKRDEKRFSGTPNVRGWFQVGFNLLAGAFVGTGIFYFAFWGYTSNFANIFFQEFISTYSFGAWDINRDIYAQIAYATMVDKYGVFAGGVLGLHPLKFQLGGHLFTAAFDRIIQRPPAFFYNYAALPIVFPMLMQTMYSSLLSLVKPDRPYQKLTIFTLLIATTLCFIYQPLLDSAAFYQRGNIDNIPTIFGYWFMFVYISRLFPDPTLEGFEYRSNSGRVFRDFILPLFLAWLVFAKSTHFVSGAIIYAVYFIMQFLKDRNSAPYVSAVFPVFAVIFTTFAMRQEKELYYDKDSYFLTYSHVTKTEFYVYFYHHVLIFTAIALLLSLILLFRRIFINDDRFQDTRKYLVRSVMIVTAVMFVTVPFLHFHIGGGSGFGMTNIPIWLSSFCVILVSVTAAREARSKIADGILCAAVIAAAYQATSNFKFHRENFRDYYQRWGNLFYSEIPTKLVELYKRPNRVEFLRYVKKLNQIAEFTDKNTMVYIDRDEEFFWMIFPHQPNIFACQIGPLFILSQSQRPSIFGINRAEDNCYREDEGILLPKDYPNYPLRGLTEETICREVTRYKMKRYVSLEWNLKTNDVNMVLHWCT